VGEGQPVSHESDLLGGGAHPAHENIKGSFRVERNWLFIKGQVVILVQKRELGKGWTEESMDVFHKPTRVLGKEMEAVFIVGVGKSLQAKSVFLHLVTPPPPSRAAWQAV
jgi:hypothetical protein